MTVKRNYLKSGWSLILLSLLFGVLTNGQAKAQQASLSVTNLSIAGCSQTSFSIDYDISFVVPPGSIIYYTTIEPDGNEFFSQSILNGNTSPQSTGASQIFASQTFPYTTLIEYFISDDSTLTSRADWMPETNQAYLAMRLTCTGANTGTIAVVTAGTSSSNGVTNAPAFSDGRINNYDTATPIVVYSYQDEITGDGFEVYTAEGNSVLLVTGMMIEEVGINENENTIIASVPELGIYALRLRNGTFQVQATMENGKTYILIFAEPYVNIGYTSYEEE